MKKSVLIFFSVVLFLSCSQKKEIEKWRHIEISPLDETQVITIITDGEKRYFMNGIHKRIPKENYLLLDLSNVDKLGDGFSICWNDNGYEWKIASTYAKLIENKLDTSQYSFYQPLNTEDNSISEKYKKTNCGNFLIRENRKPWGNLKVKYIND